MSHDPISRALNQLYLHTLLDVKHALFAIKLDEKLRGEMVSALHAIGQLKKIEAKRDDDEALACIPLDPYVLLPMLEQPYGAKLGYKKDSWRNVRYLVKKALKLSGAYAIVNARCVQRTAAWLRATEPLPREIGVKRGIQLASAWGSLHGVGPGDLEDNHLSEIESWLRQFVPHSRIRDDMMTIVRDWNRVVDRAPAWPGQRLHLASRRSEHYSVTRSLWPQRVRDEIAAIEAAWRDPDPDNLEGSLRSLSATYIRESIGRIYRLLSAYAAATKTKPQDIKSPSVLVNPTNAKLTLDFIAQWIKASNPEAKKPVDAHIGARLILKLAKERYRHDLTGDDLMILERMARVRRPPRGGMTKKNRKLLKDFEDEELLKRFLDAPRATYEKILAKSNNGWLARNELMVAFATILSMHAPLRPSNMCQLIIGEHVFRRSENGREILQIFVPGDIVKNNEDLDFELTGEVVELFDLYMKHGYGPKDFDPLPLYPGRDGNPKSSNALSRQIARYLELEIGIYMTGHKFRHVTGYLYLKDNPSDYETVRQLLGHKEITTTMTFYVSMERRLASKKVNNFWETKRGNLRSRIRRKPRGTLSTDRRKGPGRHSSSPLNSKEEGE